MVDTATATDSTHSSGHDTEHVDCIISGCGPAGIVAGLLLARGGVKVVVLERHEDFFRDFRGDTIHPSTLRLLDELGLYHRFARITHRRVEGVTLTGRGGEDIMLADFPRLDLPHPFMTIAPQWDFLNLLAEAGEDEPNFDLRMGLEATSLIWDDDRVVVGRTSCSRVPRGSEPQSLSRRWRDSRAVNWWHSEVDIVPSPKRISATRWLARSVRVRPLGVSSATTSPSSPGSRIRSMRPFSSSHLTEWNDEPAST